MPHEFISDLEEKFQAMRDIRKKARYSQQEVADLLGVDRTRVVRWENGTEYPNYESMVKLSRLLDDLQNKIIMSEKESPTQD